MSSEQVGPGFVASFDTINNGVQPAKELPAHALKILKQIQEARKQEQISAQAVPPPPAYMPDGLVIDWIDATVDIKVQIIRKSDQMVFDPTSNTFMNETNAQNSGLISLVRETSAMRAAYQVINIATPSGVFPDGYYRVFYYGTNNELIDVSSFGVSNGCPFIDGLAPVNAMPTVQDFVNSMPTPPAIVVPPTKEEIAAAVASKVQSIIPTSADNAIKLLAADVRKHTTPNSPGLAFNKVLGLTT